MANRNHYPPAIENMAPGIIIIDYFKTPFMVYELNKGQRDNNLVNLIEGCNVEVNDVACPWLIGSWDEVEF